jgi:hypothetical protein
MKSSSYIKIIAVSLFFLFSSFTFTCDNTCDDHVKTIAHNIEELRNSSFTYKKKNSTSKKELCHKQNALIKSFSLVEPENIPIDHFKETLFLLHEAKTHSALNAHYAIIQLALDTLMHIKGFSGLIRLLIRNINNSNCFSGLLYEVEKGLQIYLENEQEELVEFQRIVTVSYTNKTREFDIITTQRIIECKNINWAKKTYRKQFIAQKKAVKKLNKKNGTNLMYEVCSKQSIPQAQQQWFTTNNINFSSDKVN